MADKKLQCFYLFLIFMAVVSSMADSPGKSMCRQPTELNLLNLFSHNYYAAYAIFRVEYSCFNVEEVQRLISKTVTYKIKRLDEDSYSIITGIQKISANNEVTVELQTSKSDGKERDISADKHVMHVHKKSAKNNILIYYLCEDGDPRDVILVMYEKPFGNLLNLTDVDKAAYDVARTLTENPEDYKVTGKESCLKL